MLEKWQKIIKDLQKEDERQKEILHIQQMFIMADYAKDLLLSSTTERQEESKVFEKERQEYQTVMDKYIPVIENMTTENVQEISDLMQTIEHKLTSKKELSARFLEKLKSLNMHWNKETQQYEKIQEG